MNTSEKRKLLDRLTKLVNEPATTGGAASGLNLCDMYSRLQDRQQVLSALQLRYPNAVGELDHLDAAGWHDRLASLSRPASYVSGYVGEVGEQRAIDALARLGRHAEQYSSRIHEANDLVDADGVAYSVKSYAEENASRFMSIARNTPSSTHYVVNSELYGRLQETGRLEELEGAGIHVLDGAFSHEEATTTARTVLGSLEPDGMDVFDSALDDVPVVGALLALANVGLLGLRWKSGGLSKDEFKLDVIQSFGRLGTSAGGSAAGAAAGAVVGSAVCPCQTGPPG